LLILPDRQESDLIGSSIAHEIQQANQREALGTTRLGQLLSNPTSDWLETMGETGQDNFAANGRRILNRVVGPRRLGGKSKLFLKIQSM